MYDVGRITTPFLASMELSALNGVDGLVMNGEQAGDWNGYSVANTGDVNGDRIVDLVIGAYGANVGVGKSNEVFGSAGLGSTESLALSGLNGTNGFVLNGEQADDYSGYSVASARDVNGDLIVDLVIGANGANAHAGKSYVIYGRKLSNTTFLTTISPSLDSTSSTVVSTHSSESLPLIIGIAIAVRSGCLQSPWRGSILCQKKTKF